MPWLAAGQDTLPTKEKKSYAVELCSVFTPVAAPPTAFAAVQNQGLAPLLRLLNSSSASVQYNAAFALYELSESKEHGLLMHQAGGLQHLYVCSHRLQVQYCSSNFGLGSG